MKVVSKIIWAVIALACILGLGYIWLIGLPNQNYVATNDEKAGVLYTIQTGPNKFFDVYMSEDEYLLQTDYETSYLFEEGSITKSSSTPSADLIDANQQIYGRPGSFCYRVFSDLCTIKVDSKISTFQGFTSLLKGEEYSVNVGMSDMEVLDNKDIPVIDPLTPFTILGDNDIYLAKGSSYDYNRDTSSLLTYGEKRGTFYKASIVYGLFGEINTQLLATAKACYKLDLKEYFEGSDYYMWLDGDWVIGIRRINRNTQLIVATNAVEQREAAIATIMGDY